MIIISVLVDLMPYSSKPMSSYIIIIIFLNHFKSIIISLSSIPYSFLRSKDNSAINPEHETVFQDMTQPLSHYFINSSHNTYLEGDQLRGKSSTDAYVRAFLQGCRCVEIDCWDDSKTNIKNRIEFLHLESYHVLVSNVNFYLLYTDINFKLFSHKYCL